MPPQQPVLVPSPVNYPVSVEVSYPEHSSRLLALLTLLFFFPKFVLVIPHMIALYILGLIAFFSVILGQFAVLFTGKYPRAFFDFNAGVLRWRVRMNAYLLGLTDFYPPFRLGS